MVFPRLFGFPWEREEKTTNAVEKQKELDTLVPKPLSDEELVIVMRKRTKNPVWLAEHQKRLREASRRAAAETVHIKGPERVQRMNALIAKYTKESREQGI